MTVHSLEVTAQEANDIRNGQQELVVRVKGEKVECCKPGDRIKFWRGGSNIVREITAVRTYYHFADMLQVEDCDRIMPREKSDHILDELGDMYTPSQEHAGIYVLEFVEIGGESRRVVRQSHDFSLKRPAFVAMRYRGKDLEIRVGDGRRKRCRVGHQINFTYEGQTLSRLIRNIRIYSSFEGVLAVEDPNRIMPGWSKIEILRALGSFYTAEDEALGVYVFSLSSM